MYLQLFFFFLLHSSNAWAYIGPGAGLSAIGTILALVAAFLLAKPSALGLGKTAAELGLVVAGHRQNQLVDWAAAGDQVTLITLSGGDDDRYELDANVRRASLDVVRVSANPCSAAWNNFVRVRKLRRAIRQSQADWVVSFTETMNVLTLMAARGLGVRTIL